MASPAVEQMLARYRLADRASREHALREILQELALLGLWRGKFFEHAAFYGGTALRIMYGLDRFSEDLDFSLLKPDPSFSLAPYCRAVEEELAALGFTVTVTPKARSLGQIESAFLKADTTVMIVDAGEGKSAAADGMRIKLKFEVDTDPPPLFHTETKTLLQPIPFGVRTYTPASLFAGKMHAVLCRGWKNRVKGRDWYDLVWHVARHTALDTVHLEARMRQSGHHTAKTHLTIADVRRLLHVRIDAVDIDQARGEVERFLTVHDATKIWSKKFFHEIADKVRG